MRMNLYDLLSQREFNAQREYIALWKLFCVEESVIYNRYHYSLLKYIDMEYFRELPFRGSFCSLSDLLEALRFGNRSIIDTDRLFLFSELLIAVLSYPCPIVPTGFESQKKTILGNIGYILERTNHEVWNDENNRAIIVEKNKLTTIAAEVVSDKAVAFDLIEYNHFAIKGHLDEKKKLLTSIANYIEPILRSNVLQNVGYRALQSDAGFIFNNFHIRHNNKEGTTKQDYIASLSDSDLEEWYDKAYEIAMAVIIVNDYLSIHAEIDDLKRQYTWR